MKRNDLIVIVVAVLILLPFFVFDSVYQFYISFNAQHGMITSFIKFAILSTFGECIGLRIRTGNYNQKGFGILSRAIVWGFLGLTIKLSFVLFANGIPPFLEYLGVPEAKAAMGGALTLKKVLIALAISTGMNVIFAPVMMTTHKITDTHISLSGGTLFKRINIGDIMQNHINWKVQWNFVFAKTIPLFWIPAHTISFLLPVDFQTLFAAFLGIALGVILAIASLKGSTK